MEELLASAVLFFSRRYVAIMTRMMFGSSRKSTRTAAAALLSQKVRVSQGENSRYVWLSLAENEALPGVAQWMYGCCCPVGPDVF